MSEMASKLANRVHHGFSHLAQIVERVPRQYGIDLSSDSTGQFETIVDQLRPASVLREANMRDQFEEKIFARTLPDNHYPKVIFRDEEQVWVERFANRIPQTWHVRNIWAMIQDLRDAGREEIILRSGLIDAGVEHPSEEVVIATVESQPLNFDQLVSAYLKAPREVPRWYTHWRELIKEIQAKKGVPEELLERAAAMSEEIALQNGLDPVPEDHSPEPDMTALQRQHALHYRAGAPIAPELSATGTLYPASGR